MNTYNGWTNYATWRVNLELIDGFQINADTPYETLDLAVYLRETAILAVDNSCPDLGGIAWDYAMAFLDEVNWQEIALHKIEELTPELSSNDRTILRAIIDLLDGRMNVAEAQLAQDKLDQRGSA